MASSSDFLAYIDTKVSAERQSAIDARIRAQTPAAASNETFLYEPSFSPALQAELERIASGSKKTRNGEGIDVERYNNIDEPDDVKGSADDQVQIWRRALQDIYTNTTYIDGRITHLSLLETYGKNSWLMGNEQLEQTLKSLEKEYTESKRHLEAVNQERKARQEAVLGEMKLLEESWRTAVRGMVEVQIATEDIALQR